MTWSSSAASMNSITPASKLVPREYDAMKSWDDLFMEVRQLRGEVGALKTQLRLTKSELNGANTHCSVIQQELMSTLVRLENTRKKMTRGSTKIKACFVTHPELKVAFEEEEKERMEKERVDAEKEAQKVADANAWSTRIARGSVLKTFDFPITSYKKKEESEVLATALEISSKGTVQELTQRIKDHLAQHKDQLKKTPQFAGLFTSGRCKKENPTSRGAPPDELTIIVPSMVEGQRKESSCNVTSQQGESEIYLMLPSSSRIPFYTNPYSYNLQPYIQSPIPSLSRTPSSHYSLSESPHQHFYTVHNTTYAPK
ncbi:hypothetical protein H0H92_007768 [Tricholoma furcatifolium]|nr:hypothetical protein H0H92_007768 [Tricholoma furcatifolium]